MRDALEHAKYDGANKGDCQIRGNNAQSAAERHGETSLVHVVPAITLKLAKRSRRKKSAVLVYRETVTPGTAGGVVKDL